MKTVSRLLKSVSMAAVCAMIAAGNASAEGDRTGVTDTTIKIGMFGSLTGPAAPWGWPTIHGAQMVYEAANAAGGIHGRKIEMVVEDTQCRGPLAIAASKKLIHREKVFLVNGGSCSGATLPTRGEFISNKVPLMVLVATMDKIVQQKPNDWIFRAYLPGSYDGVIMADFLKTVPNVKRVITVGHADEHASARYGTLTEGLKRHGLQMIGVETIGTKITDATAQVLKIKQAKPDAIVLVARPAASATFLKDAAKHGLNVPIVAATVVDIPDLINRLGGDTKPLNNFYNVSVYKGPIGDSSMAPWVNELRKYFPKDKPRIVSFLGTSGAIAVVEALKRAGRDLTREKFVAAMRQIKDLDGGPMACKLSYSAANQDGCKSGAIWTLHNGKIVVIGSAWKKL
jgi:branched-chain amino acid transport system substrate-binding protein